MEFLLGGDLLTSTVGYKRSQVWGFWYPEGLTYILLGVVMITDLTFPFSFFLFSQTRLRTPFPSASPKSFHLIFPTPPDGYTLWA